MRFRALPPLHTVAVPCSPPPACQCIKRIPKPTQHRPLITKTRAMTEYRLTQQDLDALETEPIICDNPHGTSYAPMRLYVKAEVKVTSVGLVAAGMHVLTAE